MSNPQAGLFRPFWVGALLLAGGVLSPGCSCDTSPDLPGQFLDGSVDGGPNICGVVGRPCCNVGELCFGNNVQCDEQEGICCATARGNCFEASDCCDRDHTCQDQECCVAEGGGCDPDPKKTQLECCEDVDGNRMSCDRFTGLCQSPEDANCGNEGDPCDLGTGEGRCESGECARGNICVDDICQRCGDEGEDCCDLGLECNQGLACEDGICQDCGDQGEPCCGTSCNHENLECDKRTNGTCRDTVEECDRVDCTRCAEERKCGWCATDVKNSCRSFQGDCDPRDWSKDDSACPDYQGCFGVFGFTCGTCVSQPGCGWCGDPRGGGSCMSGDASGPRLGGLCTPSLPNPPFNRFWTAPGGNCF